MLWQLHRRAPGRSPFAVLFWWTLVAGAIHVAFIFAYRFRRYGMQHVPLTGPVIFVANHQSHYDPVIVGLLVRDRPFSGIARASLFRFRVLAWLMRSIGVVAVKQDNGDVSAMKAALHELASGRCVLIFPEGTRTPDGVTGAFQRGAVLLIKRSHAPVVPIAIEGAYEIWPIWRPFPKLCGRIAVKAAPPIAAEELLTGDIEAALERLRCQIGLMRLQLRAEMRRSAGGRSHAPGPGDRSAV